MIRINHTLTASVEADPELHYLPMSFSYAKRFMDIPDLFSWKKIKNMHLISVFHKNGCLI